MWQPVLGLFLILAGLTSVGFGPTLLLIRREVRLTSILGVAPAVGLALIDVLYYPLIVYIGPVSFWARPFTIITAFLSIAAFALYIYRYRVRVSAGFTAPRTVSLIGLSILVFLLLLGPVLVYGMQYAAFRTNASDAFVYMSWAESLRVVPWQVILDGSVLTPANLDNVARLAELSPTSLFTARLIARPMAVSPMAGLAWASEIAGLPVYRTYLIYHVVLVGLQWPLLLVLGRELGLRRSMSVIVASAVTLGFWTRFILESDAEAQMATIPLFALFAVAWILLERQDRSWFWGARWLLALSIAALIAVYVPVMVIVVAALALYELHGMFLRRRRLTTSLHHLVTLLMSIGLLLITAQLGYMINSTKAVFSVLELQTRLTPVVVDLFTYDGVAAILGAPIRTLFSSLPQVLRYGFFVVANIIATAISVIFLIGVLETIRVRHVNEYANRIVVAIVLAGFINFVLFLVIDDGRSAGKAFMIVSPYLFVVLAYIADRYILRNTHKLRRTTIRLIGVWLVFQMLLGTFFAFGLHGSSEFVHAHGTKTRSYDFTRITEYLDRQSPELVLVNIPRDDPPESWRFAFYSMMVFQKYPVHFQNGLIVDNSIIYRNLWFSELQQIPDYVVTLVSDDSIERLGIGEIVAGNDDLLLYQISNGNLGEFQELEMESRKRESLLQPFPSLTE